MKSTIAWALLAAILLAACDGPGTPADEIGQQQAERLARERMNLTIGAAAVGRSRVEVWPSKCGWLVVFRDAEARCGDGPFWPGACRADATVFRDLYACVQGDGQILQMGGSQSPQALGAEDQCQCSRGVTATVAPTLTPDKRASESAPQPTAEVGSDDAASVGVSYRPAPASFSPAITMEQAIDIARGSVAFMRAPEGEAQVEAQLVLFTDGYGCRVEDERGEQKPCVDVPVWLVTFSRIRYPMRGGVRGGSTTPVYNSEVNVVVDALRGDVVKRFSYR